MADRSKRVRLNVTIDVDYVPLTAQGFGGVAHYGRHVVDVLDLDGADVVDDDAPDDFLVTVVSVEVADQ